MSDVAMELLSVTLTRAPLGLKLDAYGFLAAVLDTAEDATRRALRPCDELIGINGTLYDDIPTESTPGPPRHPAAHPAPDHSPGPWAHAPNPRTLTLGNSHGTLAWLRQAHRVEQLLALRAVRAPRLRVDHHGLPQPRERAM